MCKDVLSTLSSLGLTLPGPAYLFGAIVFGIAGWAAYRFGKKKSQAKTKWIGVVLMVYPYAVSETWLMYLIGLGLCAALYYYRE